MIIEERSTFLFSPSSIMDSLRKEISTHFYTRNVNGETRERSSSVIKQHLSVRTIIPRYRFDCVHVKESRNQLPYAGPHHLNYSAVTRRDASPLFAPICLRINLVYRVETGLLPQSCLTIQFAGSAHPLLDYPELSYMSHSSLQSDMHSML